MQSRGNPHYTTIHYLMPHHTANADAVDCLYSCTSVSWPYDRNNNKCAYNNNNNYACNNTVIKCERNFAGNVVQQHSIVLQEQELMHTRWSKNINYSFSNCFNPISVILFWHDFRISTQHSLQLLNIILCAN